MNVTHFCFAVLPLCFPNLSQKKKWIHLYLNPLILSVVVTWPYRLSAFLWRDEADCVLQVIPRPRSRRSGTKSPGLWPTQPISPVCWTLVPNAWPPGSAWNVPARDSAHAPATCATWARERRKGGSSRNQCSCRLRRPRPSMNWCPTTRPIRCVRLTYVANISSEGRLYRVNIISCTFILWRVQPATNCILIRSFSCLMAAPWCISQHYLLEILENRHLHLYFFTSSFHVNDEGIYDAGVISLWTG